MSEESKRYRAEMKAKARRLGSSGDPHQRVDASSWTEAEAMNTEAPTGPRPVSKRRNYKRGGHVEGHEAIRHAGRRPRKDGGKALVRDLENADVKEANEDREGIKHEGGMKRGGRAKRAGGGGLGMFGGLIPLAIEALGNRTQDQAPYSPGMPGQGGAPPPGKKAGGRAKRDVGGTALASLLPGGLPNQSGVPTSRFNFQNGPSQMSRAAGLKKGGEAHRAEGGKVPEGGKYNAQAVDKAINSAYRGQKPPSAKQRSVTHALLRGPYATGGGATYKEQFSNMDGGRDPRKHGGKLDAEERRDMPKKEFGEPGSRKYPMPDKSHAANAKARASEMEHKGHISKSTEEKIDAKADRVLARKEGGRANGKGKMSVNIVIAPGHAAPPAAAGPPPGAPMIPPPRPPVPMPPPGMPPGGLPPGMGAGPPPMMPPPGAIPGRKHGGRLDTQGGGGGGLGRLEKIEDYGDRAREGEAHR